MCEIFCFNSDKPEKINRYLEVFYSHCDEHPHGWGLAKVKNDRFIIDKEPVRADESQKLKEILSKPVISTSVFAHIRLATMGELKHCNCHPFTARDNNGRCWMLMHNGTIFSYPELDKYKIMEKGDTDSERILLYIIDKINELEKNNHSSTVEERFNLIADIISDLAYENKLNIMIYDGEVIYIHSNLKDSLYYLINDEGFFAASTPLDSQMWLDAEINKLFAIRDGEIIFESKRHSNEFIMTREKEEYLRNFVESLNEG